MFLLVTKIQYKQIVDSFKKRKNEMSDFLLRQLLYTVPLICITSFFYKRLNIKLTSHICCLKQMKKFYRHWYIDLVFSYKTLDLKLQIVQFFFQRNNTAFKLINWKPDNGASII